MEQNGVEMGTVIGILAGLFGFGIGYDQLMRLVEDYRPEHGYTAIFVAFGVLVTLGGLALIAGLEAALWALACFAASGLPMIAGSMVRNMLRQAVDEAGVRRVAREALDDDEA